MRSLLFIALILLSLSANAGQIIATVNDQPISSFDAEARAKLISIQNSSPITTAKKKEYVKAALDALINDHIKISEAEKKGFSVSEKEIEEAIFHLESQNGMKKGSMESMLKKNQIPLHILKNQIKADLMWLQVIQQNKKSLLPPSEKEISALKNNIRNELKAEGFYVAEMLIKDQKEAENCYKELHQGKPFPELAKKYSIAPSASKGGELGWIDGKHYQKEITDALRVMSSGELSTPLKTKNGYLILLVLDRKYPIHTDTVPIWEVSQMALNANHTAAFGDKINKLNSCDSFKDFAKEHAIKESVKSGMISPEQLPRELKDLLKDAPTKKVIGPIQTPDSDLFFMKCKITNKKVIPSDEELRMRLEAEKMEQLSERLLKNAKRFSVVEMKI